MSDRAEGRQAMIDLLGRYRERRKDLERLASRLSRKVQKLADQAGLAPMVSTRVVTLDELAARIQLRGFEAADEMLESADLCQVEVVTATRDQVSALVNVLASELDLEPLHSPTTPTSDSDATRRFETGLPGRRSADLRAELQVRTLLGHAWSRIYRDIRRRNEQRLPALLSRELTAIDTRLEQCDWSLEALSDTVGTSASTYSAHLSRAELEGLASRLEAVLAVDETDRAAAERLIRTYIALDSDDRRAAEIFSAHSGRLGKHAPTLRDLGGASCRCRAPQDPVFIDGQKMLEKALRLNPSDVDAHCELGFSMRRQGSKTAAQSRFRAALGLDPTHPRALVACLHEILVNTADPATIDRLRPMITLAVDRCQTQARAGINLPWALFELGYLHLVEERSARSFEAFATGLRWVRDSGSLRTAAAPIEELAGRSVPLPGLASLQWLFELALAATELPESSTVAPVELREPVVMLSGHGDREGAEDSPFDVITEGLARFEGTLVSCGTHSSDAATLEDRQQIGDAGLHSVGYRRRADAAAGLAEVGDAEQRIVADDAPFLAEVLTFWQDLINAGGDPSEVRVIGLGGGVNARAELMAALAFGAPVGILEGSPGEAGEQLLADLGEQQPACEREPEAERITYLDRDPDQIRAFVEER